MFVAHASGLQEEHPHRSGILEDCEVSDAELKSLEPDTEQKDGTESAAHSNLFGETVLFIRRASVFSACMCA